MAVVLRNVRGLPSTPLLGAQFPRLAEYTRTFSSNAEKKEPQTTEGGEVAKEDSNNNKQKEGWISKLLVRKIESTRKPHSKMLSDKKAIYALHTHDIKPDCVDKYLENYAQLVNLMNEKKPVLKCELIGSWTVEAGDLDQAIHLWEYPNGFKNVDLTQYELSRDESYQKLLRETAKCLRSRQLQYLFQFSYWPTPKMRTGSNKYEFRSYRLAAGTMIEWGNNWAKGIHYRRKNDEAFGGYFSQVGPLYHVHHFWCYKDLEARREIRDRSWKRPEWYNCVAYTVPLILESYSRILSPTSFSPTQ